MECSHDLIIKDGSSDTKAVKITICKKCLEVIKVTIQGEKEIKVETEKEMWSKKDLRIARMSALKPATEIAIRLDTQKPELTGNLTELVLTISEILEKWIYRQ